MAWKLIRCGLGVTGREGAEDCRWGPLGLALPFTQKSRGVLGVGVGDAGTE